MRLDSVQQPQQDSARKSEKAASTRRRLQSREKEEVGAPAVWIGPDWALHPLIEHFYGHARHARASSFDEIMCSPLNATATTTLGAYCCSYKAMADDEDEGQRLATRRPFGSFAYSWTTDTSEEGLGTETLLDDRHMSMGEGQDTNGSSYAHWHRMRPTLSLHDMLVPVPSDSHFIQDIAATVAYSHDRTRSARSCEFNCPNSFVSAARLRAKLQDSLHDIDTRIAVEMKRLNQIQRAMKQKSAGNHRMAPTTVMWSLLCGAQTDKVSQGYRVTFLVEELGIAVSHRALNQLQRHRRHVSSILQIVMAHNPDLELTERQLDSVEAADAMLANDIKYSVLNEQYTLLGTRQSQRQCAAAQAKRHNGKDCFEKPHVKSVMLSKLLEAVSWYRLVQRTAREESASSCVSVVSSAGLNVKVAPCSSGLQELQVETMLDVLAGEDFYSDFSELMGQADWWEMAQAHFENLIFASVNSRICQWMLALSRDVAAVSYEECVEGNEERGLGSTLPLKSRRQRALWAQDPLPEQILDFIERLTTRVRREFEVPMDVSKSLNVFIQRTIFPRLGVLCFTQKATRECQRKDKLWRQKCIEFGGLPMETLGVSPELVGKIRSNLPSHRLSQHQVFLVRAIEAFDGMNSVIPCDLLDELMHGVVILHHEVALVLGTTQFSVETFFPLVAYVLVHCRLPTIHAQLYLLEHFAITADNANGEESYYVYCVHAAVEYVCNTAELGVHGSRGDSIRRTVVPPESSRLSPRVSMLPTASLAKDKASSIEPELENAPSDSKSAGVGGVTKPRMLETIPGSSPTSC